MFRTGKLSVNFDTRMVKVEGRALHLAGTDLRHPRTPLLNHLDAGLGKVFVRINGDSTQTFAQLSPALVWLKNKTG